MEISDDKQLLRLDRLYEMHLRAYFRTFAAYATATSILIASLGVVTREVETPGLVVLTCSVGIILCIQWHLSVTDMRAQYKHLRDQLIRLEESLGAEALTTWRDDARETARGGWVQYVPVSSRILGVPVIGLRGALLPPAYGAIFVATVVTWGLQRIPTPAPEVAQSSMVGLYAGAGCFLLASCLVQLEQSALRAERGTKWADVLVVGAPALVLVLAVAVGVFYIAVADFIVVVLTAAGFGFLLARQSWWNLAIAAFVVAVACLLTVFVWSQAESWVFPPVAPSTLWASNAVWAGVFCVCFSAVIHYCQVAAARSVIRMVALAVLCLVGSGVAIAAWMEPPALLLPSHWVIMGAWTLAGAAIGRGGPMDSEVKAALNGITAAVKETSVETLDMHRTCVRQLAAMAKTLEVHVNGDDPDIQFKTSITGYANALAEEGEGLDADDLEILRGMAAMLRRAKSK